MTTTTMTFTMTEAARAGDRLTLDRPTGGLRPANAKSTIDVAADFGTAVEDLPAGALASLSGGQVRLRGMVLTRENLERLVREIAEEYGIRRFTRRHVTPTLWSAARAWLGADLRPHQVAGVLNAMSGKV